MRYFILAALAAAIFTSAAGAQEYASQPAGYYDSHGALTEIDAVRSDYEARLADLQRRIDAATADGGCGDCCCDPCIRGVGWFGSAQAVWLKPHHADGTGVAIAGASLDSDYEVTPRLELGYARCDGLGFRVRYWEFDHAFAGTFPTEDIPPGTLSLSYGWDTWVGDIEVTDSTRLGCNWDATFAVGFRYVDYAEQINVLNSGGLEEEESNVEKLFHGYGITAAAEVRRCLSCNWGLFANTRGSAVYGDEDLRFISTSDPLVDETIHQENVLKYIWEAQLGVEWTRCIPCGGYVYARAFAEAQYWDSFGIGLVVDTENGPPVEDLARDSSVGFAGFGVSLGVVR